MTSFPQSDQERKKKAVPAGKDSDDSLDRQLCPIPHLTYSEKKTPFPRVLLGRLSITARLIFVVDFHYFFPLLFLSISLFGGVV